jgi:hypothetical protein
MRFYPGEALKIKKMGGEITFESKKKSEKILPVALLPFPF